MSDTGGILGLAGSRIGILENSFDPVTRMHIDLCRKYMQSLDLSRVILVLSDSDNHCETVRHKDRWRMLAAACGPYKNLFPEDLPDASPRSLRKKYPGDELVFLSASQEDDKRCCPSVDEYIHALGLYGVPPRITDGRARIKKLFKALNPHRFAHSLAVASTSRELAVLYGEDPEKAEEAGLFHDCAKCLPLREMRQIAEHHHLTDDPHVLESGSLLHSVVGAHLAGTEYGISDEEVLRAILYHNTGRVGMSRLAMCVCLADFIEPNRESFPELENVRKLSSSSLEEALLLSLECTQAHVESSGNYLHPWTTQTISWLSSLCRNIHSSFPSR